ncbi:MAG: DUF368 domain-containing protein [Burkholderiaceae bacterium]
MQPDLINLIRGFCMGAADIVPGVSGGTVALIMGHYDRLVTAISRVDGRLLALLRQGLWPQAARHLDLRFLVGLGSGILTGIVVLAGAMHWLLEHRLPQTLAVFLGLVLASVWVVRGNVSHWGPSRWIALLGGTGVALAIAMLPATQGGDGYLYLFLSASIAICAMILPGISGAFILLLLGMYHPVTGLIRDLSHLQIGVTGLLQLVVFASGCLFGLLAFSRLLRWLLANRHDMTMAALIGLMLGSVLRLWPLQMPTTQTAALEFKLRVYELVSPAQWSGSLWPIVLLALAGAGAVLLLERIATRMT